jgi:hypothetical protein
MSLAHLLAAGKSLVSGEDREHRYQLPRYRWLPKFGLGKNPFDAEPKADRQPKSVGPASPVNVAAAGSLLAAAGPGREPVPTQPVASGRRPGWLSRLNPFALSSGGIPALRGRAAGRSSGTRQVELSLETVKVVRNDLSDDGDEMLTPLRAQRPPVRTSNPEREVEEATVNRLNESFRRAEQVSLF